MFKQLEFEIENETWIKIKWKRNNDGDKIYIKFNSIIVENNDKLKKWCRYEVGTICRNLNDVLRIHRWKIYEKSLQNENINLICPLLKILFIFIKLLNYLI